MKEIKGAMVGQRRMRCLLIVAFEALLSGTVIRHVAALRQFSNHDVELVDVGTLNRYDIDLSRFDVIVFHYSIVIAEGYHVKSALRSRLAATGALKVLFIQDEYRWIDATAAAIRELGITVLFTVVNENVVDEVYHHPWLHMVRKEVTLTGFVDEKLLGVKVPKYDERPIDVAYRARKVPFWLGSFAAEKWTIGERFRSQTKTLGLRCDISNDETARLYGDRWVRFLSNTKAVLGTESGASVCDFSGRIQREVERATARDSTVSFEAVKKNIFAAEDGQITIHVVSPRIFEAAALRTLMVNYPGDYSGRLIAWRHYVPLAKDHSNIEEVVQVIKDPERAQKIIDAAYREVACNHNNTFQAMVTHFDRVVREECQLSAVEVRDAWGRIQRYGFGKLEVISWADFYLRRLALHLIKRGSFLARLVLPESARLWIRARLAE
jgi:hypothetical protein